MNRVLGVGLAFLVWAFSAIAAEVDQAACEGETGGLAADVAGAVKAGIRVIDDERLRKQFEQAVAGLIEDSPSTLMEHLPVQLQRRSCDLSLATPGRLRMSPADIYRERIGSVVVVGVFYHCSSKRCRRMHSSISSGVVIHEDGVLLTNYHVADIQQERFLAMGVMTEDGRVFLVDEVLAADPVHDVAILKLAGADGLAVAPVCADEPVGNPVTLITHPRGQMFSLAHGYISRYCMGDDTNLVMNITADYAGGSSGGAIFNDRGDVVGLVSSTTSLAASRVSSNVNMSVNHQMTIKNTVPSRAIMALIAE